MRMKCIILFKDIPFISAHIFAKAILIIVKAVSKKGTSMKRKYVKQIFILIPCTGTGLRFIPQESISIILRKDPYLPKWIFDKA